MITAIAFTAYPAADVARTREWYERVLGLTFAGPYMEDGIEKYNEAHIGDGAFALMVPEFSQREAGSASGVAFEVDDLDAAIARVREQGVESANRFDGPVCSQVTVRDPDGNTVILHQKAAGR